MTCPMHRPHARRRTVAPRRARPTSGSASAAWPSRASQPSAAPARPGPTRPDRGVLGGQLHVPAKAKRVIYLFMAGGPSQLEMFDYKPLLRQRNGEQLPDSVRRASG